MNSDKVLIVEENEKRRQHLSRYLNGLAAKIVSSPSFPEALDRFLKKEAYSLVVLNLNRLNSKNIKILQDIKKIKPRPSTIVLSDEADQKLALTLIKQELIDHIACPENIAEIYSATDGIPRLINVLCDNALLVGYSKGVRCIDRPIVAEVLRDMTCWAVRTAYRGADSSAAANRVGA